MEKMNAKKLSLIGFLLFSLVFTALPLASASQSLETARSSQFAIDQATIDSTQKFAPDISNVKPRAGVMKYAVVVGISDYKAISDLSYCDEDATDWYNHLAGAMAFNYIYVYGDSHTANYPKYDGKATEYIVKQALTSIVQLADSDDVVCFMSSGHGSGNGKGSSYLCMWDSGSGESGQDGNLYDTELADILEHSVANRIFVFLDHCFSGGFGDNLMSMPNKSHVYLATTCTAKGYGYDVPAYNNGAWTYFFLEYSWINHYGANPNTAMEDVFSYATANYPYRGKNLPQQYDGNTASLFYLN
jgi:hypothetical protein